MAGLSAAHLRKLADELDAEEADAKRELADADSEAERQKLRDEIAELRQSQADLQARLDAAGSPPPPSPPEDDVDEVDDDDEGKPRKHYRAGRKRGQVYQEEPNAPGVIWQGDDEPDRVEIDEEGNDV